LRKGKRTKRPVAGTKERCRWDRHATQERKRGREEIGKATGQGRTTTESGLGRSGRDEQEETGEGRKRIVPKRYGGAAEGKESVKQGKRKQQDRKAGIFWPAFSKKKARSGTGRQKGRTKRGFPPAMGPSRKQGNWKKAEERENAQFAGKPLRGRKKKRVKQEEKTGNRGDGPISKRKRQNATWEKETEQKIRA